MEKAAQGVYIPTYNDIIKDGTPTVSKHNVRHRLQFGICRLVSWISLIHHHGTYCLLQCATTPTIYIVIIVVYAGDASSNLLQFPILVVSKLDYRCEYKTVKYIHATILIASAMYRIA